MKGVVFTEFVDTVDDVFGEDTTDAMFARCPVSSGGAYTAVDTYDANELHDLIGALSKETKVTPEILQNVYGKRLFGRFYEQFPAMFDGETCPLDFLEKVETEIHIEVRKLFPDAELPTLIPKMRTSRHLVLRYRSSRRLEHFCGGLIEGCLAHFRMKGSVEMEEGEDQEGVFHDFAVTLTGDAAA